MAIDAQVDEDMSEELFLQILMRISTALDFRCDARFTYVIGNNGAGKSRLLAALATHLAETPSQPNVACISSSLYDRFDLSYSGNVRYLGVRGPANAVFHARVDRSLSEMILEAMLRDGRTLARLERVLEMSLCVTLDTPGTSVSRRDSLIRLFDARKFRGRRFEDVFSAQEQRALERMLGHDLMFRQLDQRQIRLLLKVMAMNGHVELKAQRRGEGMLKFNQLSSGEQHRALLFAKVLSVAKEGMAILIDEPEISLHLQWQWDFHEKLAALLFPLKQVHVVIATHAPVVISEAARSDSKSASNSVIVLDRLPARRVLRRADTPPAEHRVKFRQHCFSEVASHERLVLRYFETSTYNSQAVSMEIASALLDATDEHKTIDQVIASLEELLDNKGMEGDPQVSVKSAISLLKGGVIGKLLKEMGDEIAVQ